MWMYIKEIQIVGNNNKIDNKIIEEAILMVIVGGKDIDWTRIDMEDIIVILWMTIWIAVKTGFW